jgi:hypothetical protein
VLQDDQHLTFTRDGNAVFVALVAPQRAGERRTLTVFYHGDYKADSAAGTAAPAGPFVWAVDSLGAAWVATSDDTIGASSWWPLKDYQAETHATIAITVPDPMT